MPRAIPGASHTGGSEMRPQWRHLVGLAVIILFGGGGGYELAAQEARVLVQGFPATHGPAQTSRLLILRPAGQGATDLIIAGDTTAVRGPNYWAEGAAIGAISLGVPVAILGLALCEGDGCGSSIALTSLGAAAAGAFIGAMIGGAIDKHPGADSGSD